MGLPQDCYFLAPVIAMVDATVFARVRLLAVQGEDQRARAAVVAVLAQVDALPGAEREAAAGDRERQRRAEQRGLDVRGHVVRRPRSCASSTRASSGTASLKYDSKSSRTSGEAFSLSVSER